MHSNSSKRKSNEYVTLSITLFGITLVVAVLLALVNFMTAGKIEAIKAERLKSSMSTVLPKAVSFEDMTDIVLEKWSGDTEVLSVQLALDSKGKTLGYCVEVCPMGYSDKIDMMVGINMDGEITDTSIISLSDTPGIGTQIKEKEFSSQFLNKSGVIVPTKGSANATGEVALISGATYSSSGFTNGVNAALQAYKIVIEEGAK